MGRAKNPCVTGKPREQLDAIVDLLDGAGVSYWADTGTLLGLVREGKLIDGDPDIDISLLETEGERFAAVVPSILEMGYRLEIRRSGGRIFEYKFRPMSDPDLRLLDISIFGVTSDYVWCPCNSRKQGGPYPARILRQPLRAVRRLMRRHLRVFTLTTDGFPWSFLMRQDTWWIPAELVAETVSLPNTKVRVPMRYEEYLELHYGLTWRVPDTTWDHKTDDGTLMHEKPAVLLSRLSA